MSCFTLGISDEEQLDVGKLWNDRRLGRIRAYEREKGSNLRRFFSGKWRMFSTCERSVRMIAVLYSTTVGNVLALSQISIHKHSGQNLRCISDDVIALHDSSYLKLRVLVDDAIGAALEFGGGRRLPPICNAHLRRTRIRKS